MESGTEFQLELLFRDWRSLYSYYEEEPIEEILERREKAKEVVKEIERLGYVFVRISKSAKGLYSLFVKDKNGVFHSTESRILYHKQYVVYKTTNKVTGKFYIGTHTMKRGEDFMQSSYYGSGKLIKKSIDMYGVDNHIREILGIFETEKEANDEEHRLVMEVRTTALELSLNLSNGGTSFQRAKAQRFVKEAAFREANSVCVVCGKPLTYEQFGGKFCSSSCSATFNNKRRKRKKGKTKEVVCRCCGKIWLIPETQDKIYCNNKCQRRWERENGVRRLDEAGRRMFTEKELILDRLARGEKQSDIALSYGVTQQRVYEYLKEWRSQQGAK